MIVECPRCKKKYKIKEELVPVGGAPVRCPNCSNIFTLYREPLDVALEPVIEETVPPQEEAITKQPEIIAPPKEVPSVAEATSNSGVGESVSGLETTIPPTKERTKLWEKLQESYTQERKEEAVSPMMEKEQPTGIEEPFTTPQEEKTFETPSVEVPLAEEVTEVKPEVTPLEEISEEKLLAEQEMIEKDARRLARSLVKDILLYHGDKVDIGLRQGNLAQLIGDEIRKSWKFYKMNFPLKKTGGVNYFKDALNEIIGKGRTIFK